jgi:DNA-directed RNA polymerase subunit RPC12/RpoP
MRQFRCRKCGNDNQFLRKNQKWEFSAEMKNEKTTYICGVCETENDISQPQGAWDVIDADERL